MILVTGASSGLGAAFARLYDAQGYKVLFTGRSKEKLSNIAKQLSTSADYKACDLTNYADVESLFDSLERTPNTIIHSAGSGHFGPNPKSKTHSRSNSRFKTTSPPPLI